MGTIHRTGAVATNFTLLALRATSTAVFAVGLVVDADFVAVALAFGTLGLQALSAVTVMLAGAVLNFGAVLKTAASVLDAQFVLAGLLCCVGGALE